MTTNTPPTDSLSAADIALLESIRAEYAQAPAADTAPASNPLDATAQPEQAPDTTETAEITTKLTRTEVSQTLNSDVFEMQKQLAALGFLPIARASGRFDDETALALQNFQEETFGTKPYPLDGMVADLATRNALLEQVTAMSTAEQSPAAETDTPEAETPNQEQTAEPSAPENNAAVENPLETPTTETPTGETPAADAPTTEATAPVEPVETHIGVAIKRSDLEQVKTMDVEVMQEHLVSINLLDPDQANGKFNEATAIALHAFQEQEFGGSPYTVDNMVADTSTRHALLGKSMQAQGQAPFPPAEMIAQHDATDITMPAVPHQAGGQTLSVV